MAKLFNRAKMTTATTGSGTVTLGSASNGFQTFAAAGVSNGDVVQYVIEEGANFEIGTGTYSSSGTLLTRSPTESSNSNNAITLAGQATVSITAVADDLNRLQHGGSDKVTVSSTGASVTGNLAVSGAVDGRNVASDGSKLDGIESGATADQTAAQIRAKVEAATDSNVFTDADHTKLNGIEANAKNDQTITAGGGLTGGGTGDVTLSHSDTSSQASVNNSGGTVIQDVTVDTYGHVTGLTSYNLDGRYYTETEADSRFVNVAGDTMTGTLKYRTLQNQTTSNYDTAGDNSGFSFWYGTSSATNKPSGTDHAVYTLSYSNDWQVQEAADWRTNARYVRKQENGTWSAWQRQFADDYHPNADAWTTSRTLSLTGDVTGSVSWDGSANASLAATVANDSHTHDTRYPAGGWEDNNQNFKVTAPNGTAAGLAFHESNGTFNWQVYGDGTYYGFLDANWGGWDIQKQINGAFKVDEGSGLQRVFNDAYHPNADTLTTARTINGVSFNGSANITIADSTKLPLSGGTVTGDVQFNSGANIHRGTHSSGYLVGSYNSVGANSDKSNPIYTIGSSYQPSDTGLANMYGIGYSHGNATFGGINTVLSDWGLYVAANGTARIGLDGGNGNIKLTGTVDGRDVAADGTKLDTIATNANNYSFPYTVSASASNSTVVQRHSSGYIFANYFNTTPNDIATGSITKICAESGNDGYIRHATAAAVRSFIGFASEGSYIRSDANDTASGSYSFTNSYNEFGNSTGSVSNDGSWSARVNVAGSAHARFDVKSVSDGIITTMYSHTGLNSGRIGTMSNHQLQLLVNANVGATLSTAGSLSTTVQGTLWGASNDGSGSGLDADMVDGLHAASFLRSDAADTASGDITFSGGAGGITLNNSDIRSAQSNPTWTGDPGTVGKIQYHSNRWYIVADASSNRIVQFRRNNADKSYIDNNGDLQSGKAAGWITSRTLSLTGAVTGSVSWNGTANATLSTSFNDNGPNYIDVATGDFGTVKVDDDRGVAWAGYAIRDDWVFMANGADQSGIYNDTDNEWAITCHRNADTKLYYNNLQSLQTVGATGIRVGSTTSSDIYMQDTDNGERRIHCNSNRIGFLNSSSGWGAYCEDAGHWVVAGNITASGNVNSQSDVRVKENIEPISDAMQKVQSINGVTFNRNDLDDTETRYVGVIAQDVEAVLPEAVSENGEGIKQVAYGNMVGLLIEAIKEQQTQIDDLKAEIQSMKS